jgi:hypothetical protein
MSRLIAELAVATRTSPREWSQLLTEEPRMIATVLDVMERRH